MSKINKNEIKQVPPCNPNLVCNNIVTSSATFLVPSSQFVFSPQIPFFILADFSQLVCTTTPCTIGCTATLPDNCGGMLDTTTTVFVVTVTGCIPYILSTGVSIETTCFGQIGTPAICATEIVLLLICVILL
jgi:hypothetical protein